MQITIITNEEVQKLYIKASIAMYNKFTNHLIFQTNQQLIQCVGNRNTITNRNEWNEDLFTSPNTTFGFKQINDFSLSIADIRT